MKTSLNINGFDNNLAYREGWVLFTVGELQRLDDQHAGWSDNGECYNHPWENVLLFLQTLSPISPIPL